MQAKLTAFSGFELERSGDEYRAFLSRLRERRVPVHNYNIFLIVISKRCRELSSIIDGTRNHEVLYVVRKT